MNSIKATNLLAPTAECVKNQVLGPEFNQSVNWFNVDHLLHLKTPLLPVHLEMTTTHDADTFARLDSSLLVLITEYAKLMDGGLEIDLIVNRYLVSGKIRISE